MVTGNNQYRGSRNNDVYVYPNIWSMCCCCNNGYYYHWQHHPDLCCNWTAVPEQRCSDFAFNIG